MHTLQRMHGIANGRWEPTPPRSARALSVARIGVAKVLKKLSDSLADPEELAAEEQAEHERERPVAAE
ncbi:MAG TPA: hypothetical protein VK745_25755 [Polyangiaceae bacterium]|jgi:hypothetical protein|nr:hypothetical protein [Polyangiaceae bacterium]